MNWTHILPYGPDAYAYWIAGIYKIVTYNGEEFHAYFIPDHYKNWGDHVSTPPNPTKYTHGGLCWPSLESAQAACGEHASRYTPKPSTAKRAKEIKEELIEQAKLYAVAA